MLNCNTRKRPEMSILRPEQSAFCGPFADRKILTQTRDLGLEG
jgi:hypothetical protein